MEEHMLAAMEEATLIAETLYEDLSKKKKRRIKEQFKFIDKNGDGKVSAEELKEYLKENGHEAMGKSNIFSLIDGNRDGYINYDEFVILCYMIKTKRPVCNHCRGFIPGAFFLCTVCYWGKPVEESYNLCIACYNRGDFVHEHAEFLDNYILMSQRAQKSQTQACCEYSDTETASSSWSIPKISTPKSISAPELKKTDKTEKGFGILTGLAAVGRLFNCLMLGPD